MIKKTLIRAAIGFLLGMIIGNGIAFLTMETSDVLGFPVNQAFARRIGDPLDAFIIQTIVSGLFGAICFGGISLHNWDRLSLMGSCISHCLIMIVTFIPVSLYLGWVSDLTDILIMAGIQIVVYFIIWMIMYSLYKKEIRELNSLQEKYITNKTLIIEKEEEQ